MKKIILFLALIIGSVRLLTAQVDTQIDEYLSMVYRTHVMPGFSVVVVTKSGVLFSSSYGYREISTQKPFTAQTVSQIGSLTKSITALAVLQLTEKGKISLDEPVRKYLPEFTTANPEKSDMVTVRMLLSNTSGLTAKTQQSFDMSDQSIVKLLDDLSNSFILTEPGKVYQYSNIGFSIAGLLIHKVSGMTYTKYVSEHILKPLRMIHTSVLPLDANLSAAGHYPGIMRSIPSRDRGLLSGEFIPAGRFAQSTTDDLANLLLMYLNHGVFRNEQLVSSELLADMWKPEIEFIGLSTKDGGDGQKYQYGLGWMTSEINDRRVIHHGGSTGIASSFTMIDPQNELAVSLISNIDLTIIDRYQYSFGLNIVNNILQIAAGNAVTDYAKPVGNDPTINQFYLSENLHINYTGHYQFIQGGDNLVYYDRPDVHITRDGAQLKGTVIRDGKIINEFLLDFVNPALAISRNIASPSQLRFQLDMDGNVSRLFCWGMELQKVNHLDQVSEPQKKLGELLYITPEHWVSQSTEKGFALTNPEHPDIQIHGYISDVSTTEKEQHCGSQYAVRYNHLIWEKRSTIQKTESSGNLVTSFHTQIGGRFYTLELVSKPSEHSHALQQVMKTFLQDARMHEMR